MADQATAHVRPSDPTGRLLYEVSRCFALIGGLVLCAVAVLITISVTGRFFFSAPISGDIELTGIGTGIAVFAFLPWCQLRRDNVIVDFFMTRASAFTKRMLDAAGSLAYGAIILLFAWRTSVGGLDIYETQEATYILSIPRWWTFPSAVVCLVLLVLVCAYTLYDDLRNARAVRSPDGRA